MRRPSHRKRDRNYAPGPRAGDRSPVPATWVLKEMYGQADGGEIWERPWWAKLAHKRNWITSAAYYAIAEEPTGRLSPGIPRSMYEDSPFFSLLKRDTSWGANW